MRAISRVLHAITFVCLFVLSAGSASAYDACNPNSPAVPCTYNGTDFDTMMGNSTVHVFYKANSYFVDHSINQNPDYWDISNISGVQSDGILWWSSSFYGMFGGASVDKTDSGFYWSGVGTTYPGYFRYPTSYTTSNADGWSRKANSFGSLNSNSIPHTGEDWNNGSSCNDRGLPLYMIANGTVKEITNGTSSDGWGRSILIQHDAPPGYYFLTGRGELLTTIWSMYAHGLKTGQTGYNNSLDLQTDDENPIAKSHPGGQVGDGDGQYDCHLHFEIYTSLPGSGVGSYRYDPYGWGMLAYRTDPTELIENGLYQSSSIDFGITVHPYECSGSFKLDSATPNCDGSTSTSGNWTRRGAGISPELGANGIIFSKPANVPGTTTWTPNLPKDGRYKVLVYVPQTGAGYSSVTNASYTVSSNSNNYTSVTINQSTHNSAWVDIGTYSLYKTGNSKVVLEGNTGESGKVVAADAVRFQYVSAIP